MKKIAFRKAEKKMIKNDLHARLDVLSEKIASAKKDLQDHNNWSDGHKLTSGELLARHAFLKSELEGEVEALEVHGHHVSDFEASVREWFDSLDLGTR